MTKVSRIPISPRLKREIATEFWFALGLLNKREIEIFLQELLSPTEIIMLGKRLAILKQLRQGYEYALIKENIKVTDPTISKMSNILQRTEKLFFRILDRLIKDEEKRWKAYRERKKPKSYIRVPYKL